MYDGGEHRLGMRLPRAAVLLRFERVSELWLQVTLIRCDMLEIS